MSLNQKLFAIVVVAVSISFGMWVGQRDYKATCEPMGNAQGQRWFECN